MELRKYGGHEGTSPTILDCRSLFTKAFFCSNFIPELWSRMAVKLKSNMEAVSSWTSTKIYKACFLGQLLTHCRWLSGRLGSSWCQRQTWREWTGTGLQTILGSLGGTYGWKQQSLSPWPAALFERPFTENKSAVFSMALFHYVWAMM